MIRAALLAALCLAAAPAHADPMAGTADTRIMAGWAEGDHHVAALEIVLPAGWHTYWRVPGASGIAPQFDWSGSRNLATARVEWPHPEVFESFGMQTIGYHDRLVLPLLLAPGTPGQPIELDLALHFGICKDICIPAEARLGATLGDGSASPEAERRAIEAALARRAHSPAEAGVVEARCAVAPVPAKAGSHGITATIRFGRPPAHAQVAVIEAPQETGLWIGEARATTRGATVTAEARLESRAPSLTLDRSALRVTLIDPERTVDIAGCPVAR